MTALLEFQDLKVHWPGKSGGFGKPKHVTRAVDGISLTIQQGQTVAVVGESGCGKSTTGNAALGMAPITEGKILFEGRDLGRMDKSERRALWQDMQVIFQDPVAALNPRMSIARSIAEPLVVNGWSKARIDPRVDELMALVGLNPDQRNRRPTALSGGQRQRVVIARALALSPRLVICDEPVSALDVSIQSQILNLLLRLQRELGLSYLFISHDLSVVRHIADRICVMYLGIIVEEGPASQVFATPRHPYTRALLSAIPSPDIRQRGRRDRILLTGDLPSPMSPPSGCPFASRCPNVLAECSAARPPLEAISEDRKLRCINPDGHLRG
ncbi:ABC transporter ATP-binding protein [Paracoccus sp. JM45]|uniref:ABC transporter ATP-binding protein n=1 Tax=Paracoccus sp. JM45 TaxID=2283626 RepID=UPI000E6BFC8C|nr:oligopeptide/dipeptide ABC transporter ATP-binding protein [Paracoccus sp. JM45]RJE79058.1 ATP-binding cassette domain-containing protein [Paracoccus sp. JM45]